MTMFANCVTALVQSYTLGEKTYMTTKPNIVESFYCYGFTNNPSNAYILFGGDSTINSFDFSFYTNANRGKCYFGQVAQVAETTQSCFVSFERDTSNMGNPRVLINTPPAVSAAEFSVSEITVEQAEALFTEANGGSWSYGEAATGYYTLSDW